MVKRWAGCTDLLHVSCISSHTSQIRTVKKRSCCCSSKQLSQVVRCLFSCVLTARSQWLSSLASLTFRFLFRPKTMCFSRMQCSPWFHPDQAMLTQTAFASSFAHCFIFSNNARNRKDWARTGNQFSQSPLESNHEIKTRFMQVCWSDSYSPHNILWLY